MNGFFSTYFGIKLLSNDDLEKHARKLYHADIKELFAAEPESFESRAIATIMFLQEQLNSGSYENSYEDSWEEYTNEPEDFQEERLYED